jgi:hypothetical protein
MRYFIALFAALVVLAVGVLGFRGDKFRKPPLELFPDMDRQPKLRPQEPNSFLPNGISSQPYVEGTIERSTSFAEYGLSDVYPFDQHPAVTGMIGSSTNLVEVNPFPISAQFLERGQERFNIYCAPCHGPLGDGKGITTRFGMNLIRNLVDEYVMKQPDGQIYQTITHGKGAMGQYGTVIDIPDRWAIIAYLRALQTAQLTSNQ